MKAFLHVLKPFGEGLFQLLSRLLLTMLQCFLYLCSKMVKLFLDIGRTMRRQWLMRRRRHIRVAFGSVHLRMARLRWHLRMARLRWHLRVAFWRVLFLVTFGTSLILVAFEFVPFHIGMLKFTFEDLLQLFGLCPELFGLFHLALLFSFAGHFFQVNNFLLELLGLSFFTLWCMGLHLFG